MASTTFENKTIRFYFRVESADGVTPVPTSIVQNGITTTENLAHTNNWVGDQLIQDFDPISTLDITVSAPTWTYPISESDYDPAVDNEITTPVSISCTGGDILMMGISENYTTGDEPNPDYDPSLPDGPDNSPTIGTFTGANFADPNSVTLIASQPLIDGVADTQRYTFSATIMGGDPDGSGNGALPIYDGETAQFDLCYNCYAWTNK